jgi:AcrR family transcriptional regulator
MTEETTSAAPKPRYHHGDLRTALLEAAEAELAETGVENFSLRKVAKRAGVSHAAPAHHFGDVRGLLTALAALGNRKFVSYMVAAEEGVSDPADRLMAAGIGYAEFACRHPALFRLVFASEKPMHCDPELQAAARDAFLHLADRIEMWKGRHPNTDPEAMTDAMALWATAHGVADLLASGRLEPVGALTGAARTAAIKAILSRSLHAVADPPDAAK